MQNRPASASHQPGWGSHANGLGSAGQAVPLNSMNTAPWHQSSVPQWGAALPQPGMPTLRAIMQEEQQAAFSGRPSVAGSTSAPRNGSTGSLRHDSSPQLPPPMNMSNHYSSQPHPQPQPQPQQQQQQQQRSGGFYMRNKTDDSVPVKGNWAQALNRPPQEAPSPAPGVGGFGNGLVDLQMATEAFRDAFSATAPPMDGPPDRDEDPLLAEACKSPANPLTGVPKAALQACLD